MIIHDDTDPGVIRQGQFLFGRNIRSESGIFFDTSSDKGKIEKELIVKETENL
ncbi:hypothetical protein BSG1_10278 [Bacillus sp. SG-1]|nr:hypothetical protein BSG1_10278 [Bacillus sp. SG-1]